MKIIYENSTKCVKYQFADADSITMEEGKITTPNFIIADLNSTKATLVTGVSEKVGFKGDKFKWVSDNWADNADWVDPLEVDITRAESEVTRLKALREG
jgi:hypothetical protein